MRQGGAAALVTVVASGIVTIAVALLPQMHFAYWQPLLHVALETAASLIALLAGFLVLGRLRRVGWLNDLLLACALALLALLNLFLLTVPALVGLAPRALVMWTALAGSSLGAGLFFFSAFVPLQHVWWWGLVFLRIVQERGGAGLCSVYFCLPLASEQRIPSLMS